MRNLIVNIILLIFSTTAIAQIENTHWIFGNGAELDFTQAPPNVTPNNSLNTYNTITTSMSDNSGVLFYSNFRNIWTHDNTIMENGENFLSSLLFSNTLYMSLFSIQSPKKQSLYYNFYNSFSNSGENNNRLALVQIDMSKNGGLGSVVNKEILTFRLSGEHLGIAEHSNKKDYWLLTIDMDNKLHARLINNNGISSNSVISNLGQGFPSYTSIHGIFGHIVCSHDMKYIIINAFVSGSTVNNDVFFYSFDNETGNAQYLWSLKNESEYIGGLEFSPDNNYIYISYGLGGAAKNGVVQIKLNDDKSVPPTQITKISSTMSGGIGLAPDGKIYISNYGKKLSIINEPNLEGNLCDFKLKEIDLHGKNSGYLLPRYVKRIYHTFMYNVNCSIVDFKFLHSTTQTWNFGDGTTSTEQNPTHTYTSAGTYTVNLTVTYTDGTTQTVNKTVKINKIPKKPIIIHN